MSRRKFTYEYSVSVLHTFSTQLSSGTKKNEQNKAAVEIYMETGLSGK